MNDQYIGFAGGGIVKCRSTCHDWYIGDRCVRTVVRVDVSCTCGILDDSEVSAETTGIGV